MWTLFNVRKTKRMARKHPKIKPLKRLFNWLKFNKRRKDSVQQQIFEIPYDDAKTTLVNLPNIQNKSFKITKWFVKVGDVVKDGQVICELESNSIIVEFESLNEGKLVVITQNKNELKAGDEICKIERI